MKFLNKSDIGKEVLFERKFILGKAMNYDKTQKQTGILIGRVKRFGEDNNIPEFADIIETVNGFVMVEPSDYEFL